jgi:hypothetical protein
MSRIVVLRNVRIPAVAAFALALTVLFAAAAAAGTFKGTTSSKDGVTHVINPETPMAEPLTLEPEELWRLGGADGDDDEFFGVIMRILVDDDGMLYVLDNQLHEVKVYDADGSFVNILGREGEGPGEFRNPVDMFFTPDGTIGVMQTAPGRIVLLTKEGDPAGEYPLPTDEESGATPFLLGGRLMGDKLALAAMENQLDEGKFTQTRYLARVDDEGNEVARLHSEARVFDFANTVIDEEVWDTFDRRWAIGDDNRLYACTNHADYEVKVWNPKGALSMVIERPQYPTLDRSQEEIDRIHGIYEAFTRQVPNAKIVIGNHYKDIQTIAPRSDGSLWVMDSRGMKERPGGSLGGFDVYNKDGQFVRRVTLMGDGNPEEDAYFFVKDRLYVVTGFLSAAMAAQGGGSEETLDEEAEPMAVICYALDAPDMGSE